MARGGRFTTEFPQYGDLALRRIADAKGVSLILILSDINAGNDRSGVIAKAKAFDLMSPSSWITAYGDADTKRQTLENGAEMLFTKPSISGRSAARSICVSSARPDVRFWRAPCKGGAFQWVR